MTDNAHTRAYDKGLKAGEIQGLSREEAHSLALEVVVALAKDLESPPDIPPHKSLNERVAGLEQNYNLLREEVVDIGRHVDVVTSTLNHNAEVSHELNAGVGVLEEEMVSIHKRITEIAEMAGQRMNAIELKIDTHIHHNINADHTSTAIYPVGKTKADDARWEQVLDAARDTWITEQVSSRPEWRPVVEAAVDKAIELGLVSRREDT